ncbi:PEP-CTERM sorting domain-containing protein [Coraliomargarita parva]|uniref:PEP-CTERM sorting domain-containing protein n=1 Tax=Coraliomargarita parva TaxID=3014050 RepID=UPI0022B57956|nr:PEP-CTERM sorting domain-containing protein [Coraliomargarita parva]
MKSLFTYALTKATYTCGFLCLFGTAMSGIASAAILADYTMDTGSNTTYTAPTEDTDTNSLATNLQGFDQAKFSNSTKTAYIFAPSVGATETDALASASYFEFTVTAEAGYELNLESLVLDLVMGGSSGDAEYNAVAYVQADAYGNGLGETGSVVGSVAGTLLQEQNNNSPVTVVSGAMIDLSGAEFQGLGSITFQFRFSDDSLDSSQSDRLDNIVLNGVAVTVPEPASIALLGGVLVFILVGLKRRQRQKA